ncbi:hypothetical protein L6164_025928 [Bauhinia variegata]|uniref:Uncharacterized protein n=1 Tax=Bauhinia variegata TaxID=167791 RepID=A0ACB9M1R5_BAUVA|nr:hypothetical protein L6164_025928 [Bauhinia variegata]
MYWPFQFLLLRPSLASALGDESLMFFEVLCHQRWLKCTQNWLNPNEYKIQEVFDEFQANDAVINEISGAMTSMTNQAIQEGNRMFSIESILLIFVGNLDANVTDDHLRQVFGQHGELVHVKIPAGKQCGFVQFANRSLQPRGLAKTLCGSPLYIALEIMQLQKYDAKNTQADLWSVGAILFQLVTGRIPFTENNQYRLMPVLTFYTYRLIEAKDVVFKLQ